MLGELRRGVGLLPPGMRWRWAALVPLLVLAAALEAVGAAAVFGLIRILVDPTRAGGLPGAGLMRGWSQQAVVVASTIAVALFYVGKNVLAAATAYARNRCVEGATAATATALLRGYLAAPYAFHLRRNSAELVHDASHAVPRVFTGVMASALGVATEGLVALGILLVLLVAAPRVTLVAATALIGLSAAFLRATNRAHRRLGASLEAVGKTSVRHLQEAVGGIKEIKVLGREPFFADEFARDQRAVARARSRLAGLAALPRIVVETLFVCGTLAVVVLVAPGPESLPLLGLYAYAGFRVIPSANRIVWLLGEMRAGAAAVDRVHGDLVALAAYAVAAPGDGAACAFRDGFALEHVSYAYDGGARAVLDDVTLTVRRGESVGIVGTTGVGKSTLVDLIVGLLAPTSGRITVDGTDVRSCLPAWQRRIGYVPQAIFLLDGTIRRNIALGVADADVDALRLERAVRQAQLDPLLATLPAGLDTTIGERGVRLSGGERQRIGIARALYNDPAVLVLDEATSALDGRTEAELTGAIEALRGETTLIIVAHRLTSVRRCDRLVLMRDGRIADSGSFEELVARDPDFRAMAAATSAS